MQHQSWKLSDLDASDALQQCGECSAGASPLSDKRMQRRDFLTAVGALAGLGFDGPVFSALAPSEMDESRAIFDESLSWLTPQAARALIERIRYSGFNAIFPYVWHGMGTTWPSALAPTIDDYPRRDPLAELCRVAATAGVEVHPVFTVVLRQRDFLGQFVRAGTPAQMFEIHVPEFRQYIASLILEVVERYPVQGINLDYVRAGGIGTSDVARSSYSQRTGRDLLVDRYLRTDDAAAALAGWQAAAVGEVVSTVSKNARRLRPGIVISVCGNPAVRDVWLQGQDAVGWSNAGLVDVVYCMDYRASPDLESLDKVRQPMTHPEALVQLVGNYESAGRMGLTDYRVTSRDPALVARLAFGARQFAQGNGVGLYLYSMLNDAQIEKLRATVFAAAARPHWVRQSVPSPARVASQ